MEEKKRWNIGYYNSIIFKNLMHTIMCNNTQLSNQFYLGIQKNLFSLQAVVSLGKFINHDENSFSLFTQPSFFLRKTITCVGDEEILRFFFFFILPDTCFHIFLLFDSWKFSSLAYYIYYTSFTSTILGTVRSRVEIL